MLFHVFKKKFYIFFVISNQWKHFESLNILLEILNTILEVSHKFVSA